MYRRRRVAFSQNVRHISIIVTSLCGRRLSDRWLYLQSISAFRAIEWSCLVGRRDTSVGDMWRLISSISKHRAISMQLCPPITFLNAITALLSKLLQAFFKLFNHQQVSRWRSFQRNKLIIYFYSCLSGWMNISELDNIMPCELVHWVCKLAHANHKAHAHMESLLSMVLVIRTEDKSNKTPNKMSPLQANITSKIAALLPMPNLRQRRVQQLRAISLPDRTRPPEDCRIEDKSLLEYGWLRTKKRNSDRKA